ncbi:MAG TPA: PEP-CTERM sorting domain-containing protein, partial [Leptolyngbya sp.]|nr:PEP-CTERM sorting domain-containing protein [Leptolyngbya sp.]
SLRVRSNDPTKDCSTGKDCPAGSANSDFALSSVQVPEPTTVVGLGMVGLLTFARRRSMKVS